MVFLILKALILKSMRLVAVALPQSILNINALLVMSGGRNLLP